MSNGRVVLTRNIQVNRAYGSFAAYNAYRASDGEVEVALSVEAGDESDYDLRIGDTFPVGDQTWKLEGVDNAGREDWVVLLVRVD